MTDKPETTKATPRPWRVCGGYTPQFMAIHSPEGYIVFGMADAKTHTEGIPPKLIDAPNRDAQAANAALIVQAVNEYDALNAVAEAAKELNRWSLQAVDRWYFGYKYTLNDSHEIAEGIKKARAQYNSALQSLAALREKKG